MILTNDREYETTKTHLENFRSELADLEAASSRLGRAEYMGKKSGYVRMIAKLEGQMKEYDNLRLGRVTVIECDGLSELPRLLIRARVARGVSVEDLAAKLEWKVTTLLRYEESEYETASWTKLIEVASALRVRVRSRIDLNERVREDEELPVYDAAAR